MKTKRFRKWCAIFIPTLVIIFFFAGFLFAPNDPMKSNLLERYADPSAEYPFGTDALGRCILSRILYGGWTTLGIVLGGSLIVFLLGTVIGMIGSFDVLSTADGQPFAITGGVAEALVCTSTGLFVAIIALIAYTYLSQQVSHYISSIEKLSSVYLAIAEGKEK